MAGFSSSFEEPVTGLDVFTKAVMAEYEAMFSKSQLERAKDDIVTRCIERWLTLSEDEKFVFVSEAREKGHSRKHNINDSHTHETVEQNLRNDSSSDEGRSSMSAYLEYCELERPRLLRQMPHADLGQINRELVRRWNSCSRQSKVNNEFQSGDQKHYFNNSVNGSRSPSDAYDSDVDVDIESIDTDLCF